jgi:hypothetical protein
MLEQSRKDRERETRKEVLEQKLTSHPLFQSKRHLNSSRDAWRDASKKLLIRARFLRDG